MNSDNSGCHTRARKWYAVTAMLLLGLLAQPPAQAFTLEVVDPNGDPVFNYRWLVEEDTTHPVSPGAIVDDSLAVSIHRSYAPVVAKGETIPYTTTVSVPSDKRYAVTVLPSDGHTIGGANVAVGQDAVRIVVNPLPLPTAQISIFVFQDNSPINGAPDLPGETGLGGFSILLFDAAGQQIQDIFGNELGTTYQRTCDANGAADADPATNNFCLDAEGSPIVDVAGDGVIKSGACPGPECGVVRVKNLAQGKYGVQVVPPAGENWQQTSTIEGSRTVDAWVKPNEPPFFVEFGPAGHHVFIGFVHAFDCFGAPDTVNCPVPPAPGSATLTGTITNLHTSRPPEFTFYSGEPIPNCWVGLNEGIAGPALYAQPCDADSNFSIGGVPPGSYTLVVWDQFMDRIIASLPVTVNDGSNPELPLNSCNGLANCNFGDVPVFAWFGRLLNYVFFDANENGYPEAEEFNPDPAGDPSKWGIPEQAVNLRFKDGTIYQAFPTDLQGFVPFDEVFPFFKWLVAEVDFARFKATGATIVVDNGGEVPPHQTGPSGAFHGLDGIPSFDLLNPQPQCAPNLDPADDVADANGVYGDCIDIPNLVAGNNLSRTEVGEVLTQTFQPFLGISNVIFWGKSLYGPGDRDNPPYGDFPGAGDVDHNGNGEFDSGNGGISGVAVYPTTRAEDDPRFAAAEEWEPGIPRVQVNLYADGDMDLAPLGWATGGAKGPEDIDFNGDGIYDPANGVIQDLDGDGITFADVDNHPFGWRDDPLQKGAEDIDHNGNGEFDPGDALQIVTTDSWDDNLPTGCPPSPSAAPGEQAPFYVNGNPATPALDCFEGMRTFGQVRDGIFDGGYAFTSHFPGGMASGNPEIDGILPGTYVVEAVTPPGYEHLKEEDKNVDFGDSYVPSPLFLPPVCVGERDHTNWFNTDRYSALVPDFLTLFPTVDAPYAGESRPLCDRKQVVVTQAKNAAADFHMLTEVPKSGRIVGFILDDLANEFDPTAPAFGEKFAPPWIPVSIRDFTGREISRVYSDQWGLYNALVPSTFTVNAPTPSGVTPHMLTVCLNDPGPIADPGNPGNVITDPFFNRQYTQFCYTFDYWPGKTTYLDTPVLPIAAFAGAGQFPLDCEFPSGTPVISTVTSPNNGPWVPGAGDVSANTIAITSAGNVQVLNPTFDPTATPPVPKTIGRDYGFGGTEGSVTIGNVTVPPENVTWSNDVLTVQVPLGTPSGQLMVTRGDNNQTTVMGVTLHVGGTPPLHVPVGGSIQAAIDAAPAGSLIFVPPGEYSELVILHKDIKLQGWGAPSTMINAAKNPAEKLIGWRNRVNDIVLADSSYLLPGQEMGAPPAADPEPDLFNTEEGPGILVLSQAGGAGASLIDGITVTGGDLGGGIFVNGHATNLQISNNLVVNNQGFYAGGIRIGHPFLPDEDNLTTGGVADGDNDNIRIHHNHITQNGGINAAGGGLALFTGTDNYEVTANYICGNFTSGNGGGGIGHLGLSVNGTVADNSIIFNQTFNQGVNSYGGGIYIGGLAQGSVGSGSVTLNANLIQGNLAGAGDGGGIALHFVNGTDVAAAPANNANWHTIGVYNNMVVNNVAGLAGGGISLQDAAKVRILNNTVANNDSTATAGAAFTPGSPNESNPQPAGIVSRAHIAIAPNLGNANDAFSNPLLVNNVVWHNRSFYWYSDDDLDPPFGLLPLPSDPDYWDLGVLAAGLVQMSPENSVLSTFSGPDGANYTGNGNLIDDPLFLAEYANGNRGSLVLPETTTALEGAPAFDEGGNFIDVRFGPLTLIDPVTLDPLSNYHLDENSPAEGAGQNGTVLALVPELQFDFDGDGRPQGANVDIGADERVSATPLGGIDTDGDGVTDDVDNCINVSNGDQRDSDADGYGNACDTDLNNDGVTNSFDMNALRSSWLSSNADADFNGDGTVNVFDLNTLKSYWLQPPGPSALAP